MQSRIETLRNQITEAKSELLKVSKEYFPTVVTDLFVKYPEMQSFSWSQYTPYFNDGEPCTFTVHRYSDSIAVNGVSGYEEVEGEKLPWYEEAREVICKFLENFDDEVLEKMFGEGNVVVNKDSSVETEWYDHD